MRPLRVRFRRLIIRLLFRRGYYSQVILKRVFRYRAYLYNLVICKAWTHMKPHLIDNIFSQNPLLEYLKKGKVGP